MHDFSYPAKFTRDRRDGGFVITFRDIPEAISQAETIEEAPAEAAGALQAALEGRVRSALNVPKATRSKRGERSIAVPIQTALKVALYLELRKSGVTRVELARRLRIDEKEARRMLDPHHPTKADRLERALLALGKHAELRVA
jgi:antitoxin HicB